MAVGSTKVVQVTNIAPQATKDQMHILFGYLGKIEDIRLYPTIRDVSCPVQSRICYIKFVDVATVGIAQHMTNTVFIDRALIVIPVSSGEIPDEYYALEMTRNGTIVPGLNLNEPKLPLHVVNSVQGSGVDQVILTMDPNLEGSGLPPYPPLPSNYDTAKIEETRRTILMLNVDPSTTNEELISLFSAAGEVKYLRSCSQESDTNASHMLIEFTDQSSIINALKMNRMEFKGKLIEIQHATQPIAKPQAKSNEAAQKEIEEAMSRFKEAQNMINASIEPVIGMLTKDKRSSRRSRSRSRGRRRRSRSRSRSRRSRSRRRRSSSRSRRSKSRERRRRSKSRSRRRSHSRSRRSSSRSSKSRRSRSKSPRRSRQRSRDRSSRAKSKDRDRKSRDRSRDRKRSRDRDRKSKERESKEKVKEKSSRDSKEKRNDKESSVDDKKRSRSRSKSKRRSRSRDRKTKERKRSRSRGSKRRTPSPRSSRKRSRSRSRDRKREKKSDKRDKDKKDRDRRSRSRSSRSTRSHSKVPRNYDEEEKGFDADKDKLKEKEPEPPSEKGSPEKSDNMDISNSP